MKLWKYVAIILAAIVLLLSGCESDPLPVPPPPNTGGGDVQTTSSDISAPEVPTEELKEDIPEQSFVISNTATIAFPDRITFEMRSPLLSPSNDVVLEYGTNKHALVKESYSTDVSFKSVFEEDANYSVASWDWEFKKAGSIPPGTTVWWEWIISDNTSDTQTLTKESIVYTDDRFDWQVTEIAGMDIYTYSDDATMRDALFLELEDHLSRIELNVTFPEERKIKIFIYNDTDALKGALLHEESWIGAVAFTEYNTILTQVNRDNLDWAKGALPHEITHLLTREIVFGPFGDLPTWLNEGLSVYSEGPLSSYQLQALTLALEENRLLSIKSLNGSFPADSGQATLAYAESGSIVTFLIEQYGWDKMRELLNIQKSGSSIDKALIDVYGIDVAQLEEIWQDALASEIN